MNEHAECYDYPICRAFRKYGVENFHFEILEECDTDSLNIRERYWISKFNTFFNGYNQTFGGDTSGNRIPKENIIGIFQDLETTKLTFTDIAKLRNVSVVMVSGINAGKYWFQDNRKYPIRTKIPKVPKIQKEKEQKKTKSIKTKQCIICGKIINRRSTYCHDCFAKIQAKNIPSKETLLYYILRYPFTQIGSIFDVEGNAVRKWCKKYQLPYKYNDIKKLKEELNINEDNHKSMRKVVQYDMNYNLVKIFPSITEAGKSVAKMGKSKTAKTAGQKISLCCNGYCETAYGYIWKFEK